MSVDQLVQAICARNQAEVVRLLDTDVDINAIHSTWGRTPLFQAVQTNSEPIVALLLSKGACINVICEQQGNASVLHEACKRGCVDMITALLDQGADPNLQMKDGSTPLHMACRHDQIELAKILLRYGADITILDKSGKAALDHYPFCYYPSIKRMLQDISDQAGVCLK